MKSPKKHLRALKKSCRKQSGSSTMILLSYYILRLFASTEACPFYYYVQYAVVGVISFSMSVGVVGEDRLTAVMNAVLLENAKITEKPNDDIAKLLKGKKPTGKPKTAVDIL